MNSEKLAKLQAQVRIGGKGTRRRKVKKIHSTTASDNLKLQSCLKKLNAQPIPAIEEVNMFKSDGQIFHFKAPKVQAIIGSNTFVISGDGEDKEMTELAPGILNQLGPNALMNLQKMAKVYQEQAQASGLSVEDYAKTIADMKTNEIPAIVESLQGTELNINQ